MIALMLLAAAPPPPTMPDDIIVMARKMRLIGVDMKARKRNGKLELQTCRVTQPSGYAELDTIPCDAARECMRDSPPTRRDLESCVEDRSQVRMDAVVAARRGCS